MVETRRRSSPLAICLHALGIVILSNSFRLLFAPSKMTDWMATQRGGHWQFLTIIGLAFSLATMIVSLFQDFIPARSLSVIKESLATIAVPLEGVISLIYWGIKLYDPKLMLPPDQRLWLALPLDLSIHAAPAVLLWLDYIFFSPPFSKATRPLPIAAAFTLTYACWIEYCAKYNKAFPYPFLTILEQPYQRYAVYAAAGLFNVGLFYIVNAIHFQTDRVLRKVDVEVKRKTR